MKQSLIYAVVIMLTLFLAAIVFTWSSQVDVRSIQFAEGKIELVWTEPGDPPMGPYYNFAHIPLFAVAVGVTFLASISFVLGMICNWIFSSRRAAQ